MISIRPRWRDLPISVKFSLTLGPLLALIVAMALIGFLSLRLIQERMASSILASIEIRRLTLEMDRGLQKAGKLEQAFFQEWPRIGFDEARARHAAPALETILEVAALSRKLRDIIAVSQVSQDLRRNIAYLDYYLDSADQYAESFSRAVELVAELGKKDSGRLFALENVSDALHSGLKEVGDPGLLLRFKEARLHEKDYLVTRMRPSMQSAFNVLGALRAELDMAGVPEARLEHLSTLISEYFWVAEQVLELDRRIFEKVRELDLQVQAMTPIADNLIALARAEVDRGAGGIAALARTTYWFLALGVSAAVMLGSLLVFVIHRSISKKILALALVATRLKSGDLQARVPVTSKDEIGRLAETYNAMAERISELMANLRKRIELATARLFEGVESLAEGFALFDRQGLLVLHNRKFAGICPELTEKVRPGLSFEHWVRDAIQSGVFAPDHRGAGQRVARHMEIFSKPVADIEERLSDGRWLSLSHAKTGSGETVTIIEDITRRKDMEEQRLHMERQLLHAQKLESLGVLAGGIAHDFNNLLAALLGNLELAMLRLPKDDPASKRLEEAEKAALRAVDLTRQMLAYSGKGSFKVQNISLSDVVEENGHIFRAAIAKNIDMYLHLDPAVPLILADPGQMQQVVMNLITNASEAIGDQPGKMTLATGVMECDEAYLARSRLEEKPPPGRYVWVEVADTGCGMSEEVMDRIFDPFFSTKFTGRGLGMSAVLGIVRGHGGGIILDSVPGRGSVIRVLFPASSDDASLSASPSFPLEPESPQDGLRDGMILVVDDEQIVRELCAEALQYLGYRTLSAVDGRDALRLFEMHGDQIAAVILDLMMPTMDGVATFAELQRVKPGLPVILCSGYSEQEATRRFQDRGLAGFLQKPFRIEELRKALRVALKKNARMRNPEGL